MQRPVGNFVFASMHSVIDPASGSAVATLDALGLLAEGGFGCQAFCMTATGAHDEGRPVVQCQMPLGVVVLIYG